MSGIEPTGRIPVVFCFGGVSSEHEISCLTAAGVLGALDTTRFEPYGIGIDKQGGWHRYTAAEIRALRTVQGSFPMVDATKPGALLVRDGDTTCLATLHGDALSDKTPVSVAFPLLHGPYGEDGTIQGFFEMQGLRYVGAGVAASAIGMDKHLMKVACVAAGLEVAPYVTFTKSMWDADNASWLTAMEALGYPLYVKPARGGSSAGISRVKNRDELSAAIEFAAAYDPKLVVEQAIVGGREIECSVMGPLSDGDAQVRTSRPGEIIMHAKDGFYDYEAKYVSSSEAELKIPADLAPEIEAAVRQACARAFLAVGAEGLSRVDAFVMPDGRVYLNEINTMPGFTEISMFPQLWLKSGMSYTALISDLIDQALSRPLGLR
ncbi:MAG: D-alanine--D-alanine ligase [Propionibacteriaceae bacterium]|jgi:D-alanine-D-alanine ligase|nr:D-alanine--D-alanine ligase [Propionibacteriaceae bacterium]